MTDEQTSREKFEQKIVERLTVEHDLPDGSTWVAEHPLKAELLVYGVLAAIKEMGGQISWFIDGPDSDWE